MISSPKSLALFFTFVLALSARELHAQSPDKDLVTKGQYIFALAGG